MVFFYSDTEVRTGSRVPVHKLDPVSCYNTHSRNWFELKFILMASDRPIEKLQVGKELTICERKLAFWDRMIVDPDQKALRDANTAALKQQWRSNDNPPGRAVK